METFRAVMLIAIVGTVFWLTFLAPILAEMQEVQL